MEAMSGPGRAIVLRGDAGHLPLPDASVDLICTSPPLGPYFGLRSYTDNVKCYDCIQMEYAGRDPRQAWADYDAHVREVHQQHYDGQIGSEATPGEWVAALVECTREWVRVLKPSGSLFVNLGDKYDSGTTTARVNPGTVKDGQGQGWHQGTPRISLGQPKSLLGLPWRYALACVDELGLILRRDIIWSKPNGLPESVTDRCRSSHEYVFHMTVRPRYYAAVDEIREPHEPDSARRSLRYGGRPSARSYAAGDRNDADRQTPMGLGGDSINPLGKLPGSVWEIPSQPLTVPARLGVDHFAAFPMELPRRCILGWSPPGICVECGEGRRPVRGYGDHDSELFGDPIEERRREPSPEAAAQIAAFISYHRELARLTRADVSEQVVGSRTGACWNWEHQLSLPSPQHWRHLKTVLRLPCDWDHVMLDTIWRPSAKGKFLGGLSRHLSATSAGATGVASHDSPRKAITGYACGCPDATAPTRPAIVLDPFGGTGTTALVASMYGRVGVSVDLSMDYARLARWRTRDPAERARALQVAKPPPVPDGQGSLFDEAS